jgi:hypothetical protein
VANFPAELRWPVVRWREARPAHFCATIRRLFLVVVAKVGRARVAVVGLGMVTLQETFHRDLARVVVVFSVPVAVHVPVLMVVESNGRLVPVKVAAVFNDPIGPAVEVRVRVRTAAAFNGRIARDDPVKTAVVFVPTDREDQVKTVEEFVRTDREDLERTAVEFVRTDREDLAKTAVGFGRIDPDGQIARVRMAAGFDRIVLGGPAIDRIVPAKAAAARAGIAMTGAIGPISGPTAFPIATSGTTGETIGGPTSGTTGTTSGTTTITGSTMIGGIIITFTGPTIPTSTIGVGRRGRR